MKSKFTLVLISLVSLLFSNCGDPDIRKEKALDELKAEINDLTEEGDIITTLYFNCSGNKTVSWDIHDVQIYYQNSSAEQRIYTIPYTNRDIQANDQSLVDVALKYYENSSESSKERQIKDKKDNIKTKGRTKADFNNAVLIANIDASLKILEENNVKQIEGIDDYTIYLGEEPSTDKHEWTILAYTSGKTSGRMVTSTYAQYKFTLDENDEVIPTK